MNVNTNKLTEGNRNHIIRMSAFLVRRFDIGHIQARAAATELYVVHGFRLSRMERVWGELTGDIIREAVDNALAVVGEHPELDDMLAHYGL